MKIVDIYTINRIKNCYANIFETQDDDVPNRKIISANEREIEKWLDKATILSEKERNEIKDECCYWYFNDVAKNLEQKGWVIISINSKGVFVRGETNLYYPLLSEDETHSDTILRILWDIFGKRKGKDYLESDLMNWCKENIVIYRNGLKIEKTDIELTLFECEDAVKRYVGGEL